MLETREVAVAMRQVLGESEQGQELFVFKYSPRRGAHELSLREQRALHEWLAEDWA